MWRGICIIAVVLLHCVGTNITFNSFDSIYYFVVITAINFPVAVFFVISGYFVKKDSFQSGKVKNQLKRRIVKLLVPYLVWTFVYIIFNIMLRHEITFIWIAKCLLIGDAATPLYYIIVLLYFTLLTPFLIKILNNKVLSFILYVICFLCLIIFYVLKFEGFDVWHAVRYTIVWLPFYYLGISIRNNGLNLNKIKKYSFFFVMVSFVFEIMEGFFILKSVNNSEGMVLTQIKFTSLINSLCIAVFMITHHRKNFQGNTLGNVIIKIGDNSFGIFFVHCIFITVFKIIIDKFGLLNIIPFPVLRLIECFIVIILSITVIKIIRFVFRDKGSFLFGV